MNNAAPRWAALLGGAPFRLLPLLILISVAAITTVTVVFAPTGSEVGRDYYPDASATLARTAPNLLANPHFSGPADWRIVNPAGGLSSYDPAVSRLPGSGSIKLLGRNTSAQSSPISIAPGKAYTFSMYMMIEKTPSLALCTGVIMDNSGRWLRRVSPSYYAASRAREWEELTYFFTSQPGESKFMLACGRNEPPYNPNPNAPVWLDDAYVGEGESIEQPALPKRPFDGAGVRVDELGNFTVNRGGNWEPFFPFGIYQLPGQRFAKYSEQGFNCIMFNQFSLRAVDMTRRAVSGFNPHGMMSMIEIAQYMRPDASNYNDIAGIERQTRGLLNSPSADNVLAYYWDNEAWSEYAVPQAITDQIKLLDRDKGGRRIRPILMLQGDAGMLRQYNEMVDVAMTYDEPVGNFILQRIEHQQLPWTMAVFSQVLDPGVLRSAVYAELALGARGIAYYKDPLDSGTRIEDSAVWPEFPKLRAEIDRLMPVLREPQWTRWTAGVSSTAVTVGTRDYRGEGYLIVSNRQNVEVRFTVSLAGMQYRPGALADFFNGKRLPMDERTPSGGRVAISLPAYGTAVYAVDAQPGAAGSTPSPSAGPGGREN